MSGSARVSRAGFRRRAETGFQTSSLCAAKSTVREGEDAIATRATGAPLDLSAPACSYCNSSTQVENSHTNGEAIGDLIKDHALQSIGDFAVDLDPAVNRAGMHDQAIGFQKFCAFFCQAKQADVFTESRKIFSALAFVLNSQKIYDIGFRQHA